LKKYEEWPIRKEDKQLVQKINNKSGKGCSRYGTSYRVEEHNEDDRKMREKCYIRYWTNLQYLHPVEGD
jgi:hypothetical protein